MNNQIAGVNLIIYFLFIYFFFLGGGEGGGRKGDRVDCIQLHFFTSLHFHLGN